MVDKLSKQALPAKADVKNIMDNLQLYGPIDQTLQIKRFLLKWLDHKWLTSFQNKLYVPKQMTKA